MSEGRRFSEIMGQPPKPVVQEAVEHKETTVKPLGKPVPRSNIEEFKKSLEELGLNTNWIDKLTDMLKEVDSQLSELEEKRRKLEEKRRKIISILTRLGGEP